ncbi:MAG: hypothetical protein FJY20_05405 [Bacteroidetes bacterium]|nr:hypothetical protein [Bacteroidota bacterium]
MKKLFSLMLVTAAFFAVSCNNEKKDDKAKTGDPGKLENTVKEAPKATLAAHVCTDACKDGNHVYAHGEEGHTCSEACMKSGSRAHACTDKCKDGNHVFAHGEEGHTCTAECGNM